MCGHMSPMALARHPGSATTTVWSRVAPGWATAAHVCPGRCKAPSRSHGPGVAPTVVRGRVIWHLGYGGRQCGRLDAVLRALQHAAVQHEPSSRVRGSDRWLRRTTQRLRTLFPGVCLGTCLCHAINKLPGNLAALSSSVRKALASPFHPCGPERQRNSVRVCALGQRLRRLAVHVGTTAGAAKGECVRHWIPEQKAGW